MATSAQIIIRQAVPSDARSIAALHARAWQWSYRGLVPDDYLDGLAKRVSERERWYRNRFAEAEAEWRTWVAERGARMVGFTTTGPSRDSDAERGTAEVWGIYLDPEVVGTGIGCALFNHAVDDLRKRGYATATLWVLNSNTRARRFYEASGWMPDGATKAELRPGFELHEVRYSIDLTAGVA